MRRHLTGFSLCLLLAAVVVPELASINTARGLDRLQIGKIDARDPTPFSLTGRWVLTLPAGWQRKVSISRASDDTYHFRGAPGLVMNGVYQFNAPDSLLWMIEADDPTETAYEWQLLNANTFELVYQETSGGGGYLGATLSRHLEWDELEDGTAVERVGTSSPLRRARPEPE